MNRLSQYKDTIWRVPAICLLTVLFYLQAYVSIVIRFGVISPGVIDDTVSLLTSGFLLVAILVLGWLLFLRKLTRKEIFVSATMVVIYGLLLQFLQFAMGITTGPAAVVFSKFYAPLEWMGFINSLSLYMHEHLGFGIPLAGWLRLLTPWLFVLFGRKEPSAA